MLARGCQRAFSSVNSLNSYRGLSTAAASELDACWSFTPNFLNQCEQDVLLAACLQKLDDAESGSARRRRRQYLASIPSEQKPTGFLPDEYYQFEEVRPLDTPNLLCLCIGRLTGIRATMIVSFAGIARCICPRGRQMKPSLAFKQWSSV
jgi:hypothetical protein